MRPPANAQQDGGAKRPQRADKRADDLRQKVIMLVVCGFAPARIARHLDIPGSTLRKDFARELKNGRDIANADVAASLYRSAMNGRVSAQIFWMKAMAARDAAGAGETGIDAGRAGGTRQSDLSDRELARRIAFMLDKAARSEAPDEV